MTYKESASQPPKRLLLSNREKIMFLTKHFLDEINRPGSLQPRAPASAMKQNEIGPNLVRLA